MVLTFHFQALLFVKILIYHIFIVNALKKIHLWYENYQTLYMVHKHCSKYVESHARQIFIKVKNHFKNFLDYIYIF
jgi:hypothetical protein